ncbi:Glycosyltransferase involved in cell wall bisynthesis [Muriicola jejuensis]|uniref:Glycosyltransferase n=1 Tax=Muriicola jejuensis TaxID=504488 RepID=A0A6P0UHH6_9FLAO|nr:glycosyltransferase [Muriicola jejuensis]NER11268.1 glycosyltransferase [Muriicola jejuensis]SMP21819.1 Glycosyltransferase involved in cell wall bisynthesis [Muriicola jejuensis]
MEKHNPRLLLIGLNWPDPTATAAGVRMLQLISLFKSGGYQITFSSAAALPTGGEFPEIPGVNFSRIRLNHDSFDAFISELDPGIVIFDRFLTEEYFGWRVARILPRAIRIVDTEDLHSLRQARKVALDNGVDFTPSLWKTLEITKRELASLFRCDLSLIISRAEMDWLKEHVPSLTPQLFYLPFIFEEADLVEESDRLPFEDRKDFVFIGSGRHLPNTDAISYLKKVVWPLIRKKLPDACVHIYGASLPRKVTDLRAPEDNFFVKGWIPDVSTVLRTARVNLMPLRFGAGLKGKMFEAIHCGTPSAMTSIAAEGTVLADKKEYVADDPHLFASLAVSLYREKKLWEDLQRRGDDMLRNDFCCTAFEEELMNQLDVLTHQLDEIRENNLLGSMLLHHTMASSKYLSKWIGLKEEQSKQQER